MLISRVFRVWFQGFITIRWNYLHLLGFKLIELYVCTEIELMRDKHVSALIRRQESISWIYASTMSTKKINKLRAKSAAGNKIFQFKQDVKHCHKYCSSYTHKISLAYANVRFCSSLNSPTLLPPICTHFSVWKMHVAVINKQLKMQTLVKINK